MARILTYTSPARGHLYPAVPIVRELRSRGHETVLYGLASEVGPVRALGIEMWPLSGEVERIELDDYRARTVAEMGLRALSTFARRAQPETLDLAKALEDHDPDVVLVDVNCWGAAAVAESSSRPWAMYSPFLLMLSSRQAPPFGMGLAPMGGPFGRARDGIVRAVNRIGIDRTVLPNLNPLRARHGLSRLRHFEELFAEPDLLLALTAEGFEYPRSDWPANVKFVGPMNWSPPGRPPPERSSPERASTVESRPERTPAQERSSPESPPACAPDARFAADSNPSRGQQRPLILVTCSTERQRDKRLLHVALQALPDAGMSVLGTSAAHDPAEFEAPPGSMVVRYASHDEVLGRAACVVCHGGMGITQKALAAGIPVVVVPYGRDQRETARRVQIAGAGAWLSPRKLTGERLLAAVRTALGARSGARRVGQAFARAGGAAAAADSLEAILGPASAANAAAATKAAGTAARGREP
ncbi:MAG TPA: glycosyltransferase [Solirubrobacteraceae bacterium]|nr:glycosyltransferase [Solirubrobacteraceae bacterium]